jgi:hypothetical protein
VRRLKFDAGADAPPAATRGPLAPGPGAAAAAAAAAPHGAQPAGPSSPPRPWPAQHGGHPYQHQQEQHHHPQHQHHAAHHPQHQQLPSGLPPEAPAAVRHAEPWARPGAAAPAGPALPLASPMRPPPQGWHAFQAPHQQHREGGAQAHAGSPPQAGAASLGGLGSPLMPPRPKKAPSTPVRLFR